MKLFSAILLLSLFISCTKKMGPEQFLRDFVEYRFSNSQSVEGLLERTDGPLNERLSNLDEEDKEQYLKKGSLKFKKLKMDLITCVESTQECSITYTISYDQLDSGKSYITASIKKIAQLKKTEGQWKISDIQEIKTHFESKKSIDP